MLMMVSKVFGNFFDLGDGVVRVTRFLAHGVLKASVDVWSCTNAFLALAMAFSTA